MTDRDEPEIHDISADEAERRMASAGSIPFSPEEIDAMVRSATAGLHLVSGDQNPSRSPDMSPDMHDEDDFWQELMAKLSEADSAPDLTMEEAEARMAAAEEAPYSGQQIESTVRSATEEPRTHLKVVRDEPAPVHRNFFLRHASTLTKVAALFLGVALLYSAFGLQVGFADRLELEPEFEILVDPNTTDERRDQAALRVFSLVVSGIQTLQAVRREGGDLQADAEDCLVELQLLLASDAAGSPSDTLLSVKLLEESALDTQTSLVERRDSLRNLTDELANGILALISVDENRARMVPVLNQSVRF